MVKKCDTIFVQTDESLNEKFSKYPFELSDFQKYSLQAIEQGKHSLVTAHTGSGKTLPAEYAIEKFTSEGKKVIYTAPIKALSNQKYHEFTEKFPNISFGILTGDIKFNPDADCLIMTTEILRNTLFHKKSEDEKSKSLLHFDMDMDNDLACVIFDEVHYINDADRGKIWEETIIMMPHHVQMVMLSATIDKVEEFAQWVETTSQREVFISTTNHRVVPLTHYGYISCQQSVCKSLEKNRIEETLGFPITEYLNKPIVFKYQNSECNEPNFHKFKKIKDYFENQRFL